MLRFTFTLALTCGLITAGAGGGRADDAKPDRPRPDAAQRQKLLEKFDTDGDGKLNEQERQAARSAMPDKPGERPGAENRPSKEDILKKFDKDGDGKLSEAERAALPQRPADGKGVEGGRPNMEEMKKKIIAQFDKDGDGTLSGAEKQAAHQFMQKQRESRGGQPGGGRPGAGPQRAKPGNRPEGVQRKRPAGDQ